MTRQSARNPGAEVLRDLYLEQALSTIEIARRYGVTAVSCGRWLRAAGIPIRTASEAGKLTKGRPITDAQREARRQNAVKARSNLTQESWQKTAATRRASGIPAWNKGKPQSEEHLRKLIEARSTPEYRQKMSERFLGEKSANWRGGLKPEHSARLDRAEWRRTRQLVYARDNWTCRDCGVKCKNTADSKSAPKTKIQAHHEIPRRLGGLDTLDNLVTLCMSCHHKRERRYKGALIA